MQLTERDITILDLLITFGYLVTGQIKRIVFSSLNVALSMINSLQAVWDGSCWPSACPLAHTCCHKL